MQYKTFDENKVHLLSKSQLITWVITFFKKAKKISHSEQVHKHDSIFWKRTLSQHVEESRMNELCKLADESRKEFKKKIK